MPTLWCGSSRWLVGGGVALSSHGPKAAVRATANLSPEPFSNIALSLAEDAVAVGSSRLIAWFPIMMLGVVALFLVVFFWLGPKILGAIKRRFGFGAITAAPVYSHTSGGRNTDSPI